MKPLTDSQVEALKHKARGDLILECLSGEKIGHGHRQTWLAEILKERLDSASPDAQDDADEIADAFAAAVVDRGNAYELEKVAERIVGEWIDRDPLYVADRVQEIREEMEAEWADRRIDELKEGRA